MGLNDTDFGPGRKGSISSKNDLLLICKYERNVPRRREKFFSIFHLRASILSWFVAMWRLSSSNVSRETLADLKALFLFENWRRCAIVCQHFEVGPNRSHRPTGRGHS